MRNIQEVGTEILTGHPRSLYVFCGSEYGIKDRYIQELEKLHGNRIEYQRMTQLISFLSNKHLIPPKTAVYVVRYDEEFVSQLDQLTANKLIALRVPGTIVCVYEQLKHAAKLDKLLSDAVVYIDTVNPVFVRKYLASEFPNLPEHVLPWVIAAASDYHKARVICKELSHLSESQLRSLNESEIRTLVGCTAATTELEIRIGLASRNFKYLLNVLDRYPGDMEQLLYTMLSTLLELDKLIYNKYSESDIRPYVDRWSCRDIKIMFDHVYAGLIQLRTITQNSYNILVYLAALLQFNPIPEVI